ncbi:MAG: hypothetical protein OCD02_21505 [Spirochaetaceae bacterium]
MKKFNCLCCGDCCSGNMKINLNLYDVYKLGKHMGFSSTKELFEKNILKLVLGQNSIKIPQMVFKIVPYKFCPFLINDVDEEMKLKGYCSLHPYKKPLVCILAPISKEFDVTTELDSYTYTKPTENCLGNFEDEEYPKQELLKPVEYEIEYEKEYFKILNNILTLNRSNYEYDLYYFDLNISFETQLTKLKHLFLAN